MAVLPPPPLIPKSWICYCALLVLRESFTSLIFRVISQNLALYITSTYQDIQHMNSEILCQPCMNIHSRRRTQNTICSSVPPPPDDNHLAVVSWQRPCANNNQACSVFCFNLSSHFHSAKGLTSKSAFSFT